MAHIFKMILKYYFPNIQAKTVSYNIDHLAILYKFYIFYHIFFKFLLTIMRKNSLKLVQNIELEQNVLSLLLAPLFCWTTNQTKHGRLVGPVSSLCNQGILKGEVSLYCWPLVWLVCNHLYDNWQFLFLFAKQTNPNQPNRRSTVQWYFSL